MGVSPMSAFVINPSANAGASGLLAVKQLTNPIRRDGDRVKIAEAFESIAGAVNTTTNRLTSLEAEVAGGGTSITIADLVAAGFGRSLTQQTQLVAGVNAITYADPLYATDSLFIWVRQVASGTVGTITFGTNLKFADVNYVTNTFDSVTIYPFHAFPDPDDSNILKWFCVSPPNAEQPL
jgi:hypothetical protein